MILKIFRLKRF